MGFLKNIKILDLTRFVAGPHCTQLLSDLGAEIIKIEKYNKGDDLRLIGTKLSQISLWSAVLNRGKKSLSLDIKSKEGKKILIKLIKESDVLIENFRPGVMESLNLGLKKVKKINNKIIMARISGYGQSDPLGSRQAFDATVQAETGYMYISGDGNEPTMIGTVFLDYTTGLNTAAGILAALHSRNNTGKGELIETSLVGSALSLSMEAIPNFFLNKKDFEKNGNSDRFSSPSNTYKAKDGYIHIMAGSNDRFLGLTKAMNNEKLSKSELFTSPEKRLLNQNKIDKIVNRWTKTTSITKLGQLLTKYSVPWGRVKKFKEFLKTATAKNHLSVAKVGNKNILVPKCVVQTTKSKNLSVKEVPEVGQHNLSILKKLGYKNKELLKLKNKRIID